MTKPIATPRTDDHAFMAQDRNGHIGECVTAAFARELEGALSDVRSELEQEQETGRVMLETIMHWEGQGCGGDCLAAPCGGCDGTGYVEGKGKRLERELAEEKQEHQATLALAREQREYADAATELLRQALPEVAGVETEYGETGDGRLSVEIRAFLEKHPESEIGTGNWTEDAAHENGNYECSCVGCGKTFIGHKRRVLCKVCHDDPSNGADLGHAVGNPYPPNPRTYGAQLEWLRSELSMTRENSVGRRHMIESIIGTVTEAQTIPSQVPKQEPTT